MYTQLGFLSPKYKEDVWSVSARFKCASTYIQLQIYIPDILVVTNHLARSLCEIQSYTSEPSEGQLAS